MQPVPAHELEQVTGGAVIGSIVIPINIAIVALPQLNINFRGNNVTQGGGGIIGQIIGTH